MADTKKIAKRFLIGGIVVFGVGFALALLIAIIFKEALWPAISALGLSFIGLVWYIWEYLNGIGA